jgi:SAM-dependent methyltransferase
MLTHKKMVEYHAESHDLIAADKFSSKEDYVSHLMHLVAYEKARDISVGGEILDLGCNTGYGSKVLSACGKVSSIDVSEKAISAAKALHGAADIDFQVIDGESLPFENGRFQMIVSFQVIEHIVDYQKYLGEIKRVLSPGGIVVFTTPNARLRLDKEMKPWNPFHVREFDSSELESLLRSSFDHVGILGLFAKEPIYSIEAGRLTRNRENTRDERKLIFKIKSSIKKMIPSFMVSMFRGIRDLRPHRAEEQDFSGDFVEKYGTGSFFYKQDDYGNALDLLAFCSDSEEKINQAIRLYLSCK